MSVLFENRIAAGLALAGELVRYQGRPDLLVLGLPRGGVPVAAQLARALSAELDVIVVRKIGAPWQPELALGAVASGGLLIRNDEFSDALFETEQVREVTAMEFRNVAEREARYREQREPLHAHNREVILADDGAATGASMLAAIQAMRRLGAARIVVALPVAPQTTLQKLATQADEVVCIASPPAFQSVGEWYRDFSQVSDEEVCALLRPAVVPSKRHRIATS